MANTGCIYEGLEMLLRLKDTERALVATVSNGQLVVQSIHSLQASDLDGASPVTTVLTQMRKQPKALLVLDAEQETLLARVPEDRRQELRSAVCVPILGESEKLLGILYADSRARVGNFSYADLNQLQTEAQALAPSLEAFLVEQSQGKSKGIDEPVVSTNHLMIVATLIVAAVLWFVIGAFFSRAKPKPPEPELPGLAKGAPPAVVSSFLAMVSMGDYGSLDLVLSERMKKQWPAEQRNAAIKRWRNEPLHKNDLRFRNVRAGTGVAVGDTAEVIVDTRENLQVRETRYIPETRSYRDVAVAIPPVTSGPSS